MAKSARSSTRKANNQRLKANVFGPIEAARAERLSAKLLELAAQPKPPKPESNEMRIEDDTAEEEAKIDEDTAAADANDNSKRNQPLVESHGLLSLTSMTAMDVDSAKPTSAKRSDKKRIEKRKKKSKIVFPKYSDKKKTKKR
ncbi:hypothetical protein M434DRAFT_11711 [Hypoxylon sp. CO27-5]|nr:hypothetical protein M434DRAFT_11711 [Hypoxylon sp. CO27-5]